MCTPTRIGSRNGGRLWSWSARFLEIVEVLFPNLFLVGNKNGSQILVGENVVCNPKERGRLFTGPRLRGKDLNLRPLGYEPNELPLLHPAVLYSIYGFGAEASMAALGRRPPSPAIFQE